MAAMPKAELHLHLDGCLRPETALELARRRGLVGPRAGVAAIRRRLTAPRRCADQAEYLRAFDLPVAILQDEDSLERVARELVVDVAADGTRYVEVRWAPALHVANGLSLRQVIAAVAAGTASGAARTGVTARLIATAMRQHDPERNVAVAEEAARARPDGLVGFDLAGPEAAFPDPRLHRRAYAAAAGGGLRLTVHAGEWDGADQVRRALELSPERIAHGAVAVESAGLMAELRSRRVTLDLCPSSNVQAGLYRTVADHPIRALVRAGVPATLSTDARTVASLTLVGEYRRVLQRARLSLSEAWTMNRHALDVAFADEMSLLPLRRAFDAWAADRLELSPPG